MRTWTPPLLLLATLAAVAWKPKPLLRLLAYIAGASILLAASTALAGWLMWQTMLYLLEHSR
jgi:hypothetical protein